MSRDDLLNEVGKIVENKPFATWLTQNQFAVNSNLSTDTKVTAIWLIQLIHQQAIDELFATHHLKITPALRTQAGKDVVGIFPAATIFPAFDAKFRATLTDRQARTEALLGAYTDTSDAAGQKYYDAHQAQFACASGKNVVAHPRRDAGAGAEHSRPDQGRRVVLDARDSRTRPTRRAARRAARSAASRPARSCPRSRRRRTSAPHRHADRAGAVAVRIPRHPRDALRSTSYAAARSTVQQALTQQGQADAQDAIDALLKAFKVHLDPRFGTWGVVTNSQGQKVYEVTAPTAPTPNTSREGTPSTTTTTVPAADPGASTGTP